MRVVALFATRNERPYLANCLDHLIANGVDYFVLDNDSTDGTAELLQEPRFARHLVGCGTHPFRGLFDWEGLLGALEAAVAGIDADWLVLLAPDEVMHPYTPDETLREAIVRIDAEGFDVIDFNEFVFLPVDHDYLPDHAAPQPLHWYYFHEPSRPRLMRARRKSLRASWLPSGGHRFDGQSFRLAEESFALRHYIFRSQTHAFAKYAERSFRQEEIDRSWHRNRLAQPRDRYALPPKDELDYLADPNGRRLSRARPRKEHYWEWPS